ncbi:MAG: hypothetical protein JWQ04_2120 [Pedosphaera sp.]|nr:hypothetical protein [Pedosphaera sp.]
MKTKNVKSKSKVDDAPTLAPDSAPPPRTPDAPAAAASSPSPRDAGAGRGADIAPNPHDATSATIAPASTPHSALRTPNSLLKKVRSNATWNQLKPKARAQLETWLFEENLSYSNAFERAQKELGFQGSITSLRRFAERAGKERTVSALLLGKQQVKAIEAATDLTIHELCEAGMKVVAQLFLNQVTTQPHQTKQWGFFASLLMRHQANESRTAVKLQENQIRQSQHDLAREKWDTNLRAHAKLASREQAEADRVAAEAALEEQGDAGEEFRFNQWSNRECFKLFGKCSHSILPENQAQKEAMESIKALPPEVGEAERQRLADETFQRVQERIAEEAIREARAAEEMQRAVQQSRQEAEARQAAEAERDRQREIENEQYRVSYEKSQAEARAQKRAEMLDPVARYMKSLNQRR